MSNKEDRRLHCSFCGKSESQAERFIAGPGVCICNECVQACVELDGGTKAGLSWFDDVRLYELPIVANGSFELGKAGWETTGTVSGGKLTLENKGGTLYVTVKGERGRISQLELEGPAEVLATYEL